MRKQYLRRDPEANPLGVEPPAPSRKDSREPTAFSEPLPDFDDTLKQGESLPQTPLPDPEDREDSKAEVSSPAAATDGAEQDSKEEKEANESSVKKEDAMVGENMSPQDEPKDWFHLPLLTKLDSLHLLTEWQFQNPHRLRQFMKDDGDAAQWVCISVFSLYSMLMIIPPTIAYRADRVRCKDQCVLAHRA